MIFPPASVCAGVSPHSVGATVEVQLTAILNHAARFILALRENEREDYDERSCAQHHHND
jgi:hypothetical protein